MKYLHVASKPNAKTVGLQKAIVDQTGSCLYSLIEGLRQAEFNTHTLNSVARNIQHYRAQVIPTGELFTDSGGYSIIKGDVHPRSINRFIQCYHQYFEHEHDVYNYIFSLDIPFSKGFEELNTKGNIYSLNKQSLLESRELILAQPSLAERFFFVWQFKMPAQYEIWKTLYAELELNRFISHRAIGGMVALRGMTKIAFSPFTALAYRCLLDYLDARRFTDPFTLHLLGMYIQYDRLHMAVLESLFSRYLDGAEVRITYDSVNFSHTARLNTGLSFFHGGQDNLTQYPGVMDVPEDVLKGVYGEGQLFEHILKEVGQRREGAKLDEVNAFAPLNVHSNLCLDAYFMGVVQRYALADLFFTSPSATTFSARVETVISALRQENPFVFTSSLVKAFRCNMGLAYHYHRWFIDKRCPEVLDRMVRSFIGMIKFPFDLT